MKLINEVSIARCGLSLLMAEQRKYIKSLTNPTSPPRVQAATAASVIKSQQRWSNNFRRLAKYFEILTVSMENIFRIAMIQIILERVTS
jgi:hypothetical protein